MLGAANDREDPNVLSNIFPRTSGHSEIKPLCGVPKTAHSPLRQSGPSRTETKTHRGVKHILPIVACACPRCVSSVIHLAISPPTALHTSPALPLSSFNRVLLPLLLHAAEDGGYLLHHLSSRTLIEVTASLKSRCVRNQLAAHVQTTSRGRYRNVGSLKILRFHPRSLWV